MTIETTQNIDDTIANSSEQYVTFLINDETYGIEVLRVKEIVGMTTVTSVPNSEKYLKGVINLRGIVVPVIDLRLKFNIPEKEYDSFTVILIIEHRDSLVGVIVDSVSDVISAPGQLQEVPNFHVSIDRDVIKGVLNKDNNLIIILNPDIMLSLKDLEALAEIETE
ncbi:MAG TPA: chemotaxis protein CheW [Spirochaetota bacterium]|nr:chemotaxis protein CheW [Spirochaetota bacterium]HPJ35311.1 chemotaxis protein CheW [Spirochaetota bacterium]